MASGGAAAPAPPVFVSYEEKREQSERKAVRKSSGHTYTVKFFLVDLHGREHLAATGAAAAAAAAAALPSACSAPDARRRLHGRHQQTVLVLCVMCCG